MSYVIAAYGVTVVSLVGYAVSMLRERGRLARDAENTPEESRTK